MTAVATGDRTPDDAAAHDPATGEQATGEQATGDPATGEHVAVAARGRRPSGLRRAVFLLPAGLALLAGLDAALLLLGVAAPVSTDRLPAVHGMVLVLGFVGTLVALERAVALQHRAGYLAPALLGLGAVLLVSPAPLAAGQTVQLLGALALVGVYVPLWRRQRDDAVLVQALGAVLAVGALTLWIAGVTVATLLPWLVGFLVLTLAGERLELARIAMGAGAGPTLVLLSGAVAAGVVSSLLWPQPGSVLLGLTILGLGGWLAAHDVARRTIRGRGLTRFMAGCMIAGYFWLLVAGATWLVGGPALDGPRYDVVIHAVFLGFVLSMVMAHAPVILPAVLRRALPYSPALIAPVVLLHLSLVLRLWIGDAFGVRGAWQAGGVLNVTALLLFVGLAAWRASCSARSGREVR